jgi:hypothetical protein
VLVAPRGLGLRGDARQHQPPQHLCPGAFRQQRPPALLRRGGTAAGAHVLQQQRQAALVQGVQSGGAGAIAAVIVAASGRLRSRRQRALKLPKRQALDAQGARKLVEHVGDEQRGGQALALFRA